MKKLTVLVAWMLCIFLLAGCMEKPQNPSDNAEIPNTETPTGDVVPSESAALVSLRRNIVEQNNMLGIGFVGYIDSESDAAAVQTYLIHF